MGMLSGLRGKLPKEINLPASVTVPFGSFEEVLKQPGNKQIKKELEAAIKDIPVEKAEEALSKCRQLVMQVSHPWKLSPSFCACLHVHAIPERASVCLHVNCTIVMLHAVLHVGSQLVPAISEASSV